jgi:hypothetical protein
MAIKQPRLQDMWLDAVARERGERPELKFGRRQAVVQCSQHPGRFTVAEVRGSALFGTTGPHDLNATEAVFAACEVCPQGERLWRLDLAVLRQRLREPHARVLKVPVELVARLEQSAWSHSNL